MKGYCFLQKKKKLACMQLFIKPNNMAYVVRGSMADKFLKHKNIKDLEYIKSSALNFKKNLEKLKDKSICNNVTKSEYCIDCNESYQNKNTYRWYCRRTSQIVVGTDGRATVNAMKCH